VSYGDQQLCSDFACQLTYGGEDGDGLLGHVDTREDGGRLRDTRQTLGQQLCTRNIKSSSSSSSYGQQVQKG
jgi:hypothetical protein